MLRFSGLALAAVLAAGTGCSTEAPPSPAASPLGPASVQPPVVARHAEQFDVDLAERTAGSQIELGAATYLLAHMQQAGYVGRLEGVPVGDLVRSTNVIASVPETHAEDDPLVVVSYDAPPDERRPADGSSIGLWLEVARGVNVAAGGRTDVAFAALGAEHATNGGGRLGSRRLAAEIAQGQTEPELIVVIGAVGPGPVRAAGPAAAGVATAGDAADVGVEVETAIREASEPGAGTADVLSRVASSWVLVSGPAEDLGPVLMEFLAS